MGRLCCKNGWFGQFGTFLRPEIYLPGSKMSPFCQNRHFLIVKISFIFVEVSQIVKIDTFVCFFWLWVGKLVLSCGQYANISSRVSLPTFVWLVVKVWCWRRCNLASFRIISTNLHYTDSSSVILLTSYMYSIAVPTQFSENMQRCLSLFTPYSRRLFFFLSLRWY